MKMKISPMELKRNNTGKEYAEGFRVVYFYDNYFSIGEYCKTIEGFMTGFTECDPIMDEDIPDFISVEDLLNRYLDSMKNITSVAIYDINGNCIAKKERIKNQNLSIRH